MWQVKRYPLNLNTKENKLVVLLNCLILRIIEQLKSRMILGKTFFERETFFWGCKDNCEVFINYERFVKLYSIKFLKEAKTLYVNKPE